ncbi:hypothetical protein D8674_022145 [Pyrus ussuriensis x Pyrus communis]|uniref:RNase H type-1 domain-containing protein n=1 Tax=Pyrus ussuriensis x Pyrus communis TaxID=2448454 RepID=A0A5N5GKB6_9ROSA|nr:hypothetical protein D8674_022145 [Pyrus ussuriensis x Pyrus communis]
MGGCGVVVRDTRGKFAEKLGDAQRQLEGDALMGNVSFYKREANKVAHRLVKFSLTSVLEVAWFEDPSDIILNDLVEDKI